MRMTSAENNKEIALHKRVRPANDWHRILCRFGDVPPLRDENSKRFNSAVDQLVQRFQSLEHESTSTDASTSACPTLADRSARPELLDLIPDAILSLTIEGHLLYANQSAIELIALITDQPDCLGTNQPFPFFQILKNLDCRLSLRDWIQQQVESWSSETSCQESTSKGFSFSSIDGRSWDITTHCSPLESNVVNVLVRDVSRLNESKYRAQYNSQHDALTGLPNRVGLLADLRERVANYDPNAASDATFFFDLDGFKFVNDSLGHQAGDELLCAVARRIQSLLTPDQRMYRLGGDEFVVQVNQISNLHEIPRLAEKLGRAFVEPFNIQEKDTYLGASIGIAILNDNTESAEQLIQQADLAMYQAKEAGGHGHSFYNADVEEEIQQRYALRAEIRHALQDDEFTVFYQPKYDLKRQRLCGAEALIRWIRDGKTYSSPAEFIPEAETCGLIVPISQLVFKQVATDVRRWEEKGFSPIVTSVNVSACHFQLGDLMDDLMSAFLGHGVAANRIELEITESSFINDMSRAIEKIRMLQRFGFGIAIDDFGTGYSSLSYLKNLPADVVKIDRAFVSEIESSDFDATLVQSVIKIAHTQGLKVVAEGVETDAGIQKLTEFDCDQVQGYWYGKPLSAEDFEEQFLAPLSAEMDFTQADISS